MPGPPLSLAAAAAAVAAGFAVFAAVHGCGGISCSETATCPGGADGGGAEARSCLDHEICDNGIDDDCNGKVDCADPDCTGRQGFECVPSWPSGGAWMAAVALYDETQAGGPAPLPAACAGGYPREIVTAHATPVAAPAQCTCSCGSMEGASCSDPFVGVWVSGGCFGAPSYAGVVSACTVLSTQGGNNSAQILDGGVPSGGACPPDAGVVVPAWDPGSDQGWTTTGRLCGPASPTHVYYSGAAGGCLDPSPGDAGTTCVERPPATFSGSAVCLMSSGQVRCPSGYIAQHTYYDGGTDTRGCSGSCECSPPAEVSCSAAVTLMTGRCPGTSPTVPLGDTTCRALSNFGNAGGADAVSATATTSAVGGSCSPNGNFASTGTVTPSAGAITVCCQSP